MAYANTLGNSTATAATTTEDTMDTHEGEDVTLECRFQPPPPGQTPTYFWLRTIRGRHDNVAVQQTPLELRYKLDFRPTQGRYDLLISNASYERDNGRFECRVKAAGSGQDLHAQTYELTVLSPPAPPTVAQGPSPTVTESKPAELSCSSSGGSPDPTIRQVICPQVLRVSLIALYAYTRKSYKFQAT